ncbi:hypothetical protein ACHAWO_007933 [Cyclotella atomus]|uniref:Uncharacterized protein n=1 Tax=Cyclotella atomus TaxID=382360 RepID=A0ABD3MLP7_9STRA
MIASIPIIQAFALLLTIGSASAYINHDHTWNFNCAATGQTTTATLITRLDTDEPGITTYDIGASITWGDESSDGDDYTLAVGEIHKITFEHVFKADGGQQKITLKYRRYEIPAENTALGESYAAIGSTRTEIVEVSDDECIVVDGDDADALKFTKNGENSADAFDGHYLMLSVAGYLLFQWFSINLEK